MEAQDLPSARDQLSRRMQPALAHDVQRVAFATFRDEDIARTQPPLATFGMQDRLALGVGEIEMSPQPCDQTAQLHPCPFSLLPARRPCRS
ncbi:hypothetical protein QP162_07445 [Sphingomonas aurantiaca]